VLEREGLIVARDCHVATMSGVSGVSARDLGVIDGSTTTAAAAASCAEQVDGLQSSASETGNEAALAQLGALLQATFFEAHAMQRRVIDETVLDEAALGLVRPNVLHAIRADMAPFEGRAEPGHYVEVLAGPCVGKRGVVSARPFRVRFVDGTSSEELRESDFRSSGLDEQSGRAFEARQRQQRLWQSSKKKRQKQLRKHCQHPLPKYSKQGRLNWQKVLTFQSKHSLKLQSQKH
jgi:hypothetical protein